MVSEAVEHKSRRTCSCGGFPVATSVRYGALDIAVTSSFSTRWTDRGSGGVQDFSAHAPMIPIADWNEGWRILAHVGRRSHEALEGKFAVVMARGADPADALLKPPVDFQRIWTDEGSGAKDGNGSVWRPIPPDGYVALGDVWSSSWDKPAVPGFACVRRSAVKGHTYVREGAIGSRLWYDQGTGAKAYCSVWPIVPPPYPLDSTERLLLDVGGSVANDKWEEPNRTVYVLDLPAVVVKQEPAPRPVQTSHDFPDPRETPKVLDRQVTVPCTVVSDPGKTPGWQAANSPFYTMERRTSYFAQMHNDNSMGGQVQEPTQSVTTGVTESKSEEFSSKTGVTVTAKAGIEIKALSAGVETSVTREIGYSTRTEVSVMEEQSFTWTLRTLPKTSAVAWSPRHDIRAVRADGDPVAQAALVFDVESRTYTQYPPANDAETGQDGTLADEAGNTGRDVAPFGAVESNLPSDTTGIIIP
ncbi:Vps62-related protein [Streptomyces noursei]